jgi:hypothetical protein
MPLTKKLTRIQQMTDKTPVLVFYRPALERRYCEAGSPMPMADKDRYQWGHGDAVFVEPFFNLGLYKCPHCGLTFHAAIPAK